VQTPAVEIELVDSARFTLRRIEPEPGFGMVTIHVHAEDGDAPDALIVPLGSIRLRPFGGTGGHQGLESIREEIGTTEFPRLRIGVGPAPASADLPDFVLSPFDEEERARLPDVLEGAASAAYDAAASGLGQAMNRWNRFGLDPVEE